MVGVGSMGSMMSLLFAENGYRVYFFDISESQTENRWREPWDSHVFPDQSNMDATIKQTKDLHLENKVISQKSYKNLCGSICIDQVGRLLVFSIPHGSAGDECVKQLRPHLDSGDIILDCSNEHYENTERRQRGLEPDGIFYVGCGVSGGYQSARSGPSMSPGGDSKAIQEIMPILRRVAAKDEYGNPCVGLIGPGGSGHYVKMVHNGIEQGMMSVIAEAWFILTQGVQLAYDEVGDIFRQWNDTKELHGCFLIYIGIDIDKAKDVSGHHPLGYILDKVVQDIDETEGTGTWTCNEAVRLHSPASTILSAHLLRCASADLKKRLESHGSTGGLSRAGGLQVDNKTEFLEQLRRATYFSLLLCFIQGTSIIRAMDQRRGWGINYPELFRIWSAGSIIRANQITTLLQRVCSGPEIDNFLSNKELHSSVAEHYDAAKQITLKAIEADLIVPAISQSLEYSKYMISSKLPTQFMEAELDYFGNHKFDMKGEEPGQPKKGSHHFEWKPAKGKLEK
jgi:6-phosphogluconate dehydrogenase